MANNATILTNANYLMCVTHKPRVSITQEDSTAVVTLDGEGKASRHILYALISMNAQKELISNLSFSCSVKCYHLVMILHL